VATIAVTSDINTIVAVGRSAQLTAVARAQSGGMVDATFRWTSSNPAVAAVSTGGLVQGVAVGNATISAEADGKSGSLSLRVVGADLGTISLLLADPVRSYLVGRLPTTRNAVESALATADQALISGNIVTLNASLTAVADQARVAAAADDRAILATLALLTDFAIRLLHL
jgi:hypothetical protein